MAEENFQSRTEAPSPRRREKARQQGQVAVSADLNAGVLLLAGSLGLMLLGGGLASLLLSGLRLDLLHAGVTELGPERAQSLMLAQMRRGAEILAVVVGLLFAVGAAVGVLQVGFHVSPELLQFRWEKLSPVNGWSRLFSSKALARGLFSVAKVAAVAGLMYWMAAGRVDEIGAFGGGTLAEAVGRGWGLAVRLALVVAVALTVLGVLDYLWQRWQLEQSLMMTREEKKQELKEEEGDPHVKARRRRLQRDTAQNRGLRKVPTATVVITNPTHLAVALRYDQKSMPSPQVVAKGSGRYAQRLAGLARRHAVPVVERKEVARALFKAVKVDQQIPPALFQAVAEVLAFVYRLRQ